jgi:hypothetical protein
VRSESYRVDPSDFLDGIEHDQLRHALDVAARTFREHALGMRLVAEADTAEPEGALLTKRGAEQLHRHFVECAERTEALSERLDNVHRVAFLSEGDD